MKNFIKNNRRFIVSIVCLLAVALAMGLKNIQQINQLEAQKENIIRLEEEVPRKKEEKKAALKDQKAAEKAMEAANKAKKKAKTAADKLAKTLTTVEQEIQQNEAAQAESLTALNNVLDMLNGAETADPDQLLAELEKALTALGGTMPGTATEEGGTEK